MSTRDVLAGVDLELAAGTSTALVGVNGAGKSTLVSLLARLRDPTSGAITVDGTDIRDLDPGRWQRTIALMPQDPVRYPLTAYDNVAFGAVEHADDRAGVLKAAKLSGFSAVADELPLGWDTVLSRELPGGAELSGGQWQRLALARALFATFHGARVLVLDEPTAALDVRAEARFYERFHEITAGLTTLVISHRFATVRRAHRIYGLAPRLKSLHASLTASLDRRAAREARRVLAVQSAGWLLYAAGLMGAIAFVVIRASDGAISLGTVLMTVSLIRRSRAQLASAASGSAGMIATLATADRLLWLEDHHAAAVAAAGTGQAPARLRSGIALRDLTFKYPGTERLVLSSLDLTLPAGATVAVVGENGSGKTTLVKLLLGMYQPTSGTIEVDGVPLNSISHESWRQRCTAAFQDFARFSLPAVESVGVADLPDLASEPLAQAALDRAGATELAGQLPSGLATYVGSPYTSGHNLSGGQWQKLALGRAMRVPDPLLVVLDEPTASLDAHAEQALFDRYTEAAAASAATSGTITLLVSHRFATVRMADLIIYLEAGHATEAGTHDELLARSGRYAELFTLQASGYR